MNIKIKNIDNSLLQSFVVMQRLSFDKVYNVIKETENGYIIDGCDEPILKIFVEETNGVKEVKKEFITQKVEVVIPKVEVVKKPTYQELLDLNKNEQIAILKKKGYSDKEIKSFKKEDQRIVAIMSRWNLWKNKIMM